MRCLFHSLLEPFAPTLARHARCPDESLQNRSSAYRPPIEALEGRRLLSTTVAAAGGDAGADAATTQATDVALTAPVARYYGGTVSFGRVAGQPRRAARDVVVNITSADAATGQVAGTLSAAGLGNVAFTGQVLDGNAFALTTTGDVAGDLTGRLRGGGSRLAGTLAADDGTTLRLNARALTPIGTLANTGGTAAAATNFTGSTTGTVALRQRADALALGTTGTIGTFTTGRQNVDLVLDITSQNADRTLAGTLNAGALGTYNVSGVATGNRLTLITTPQAGQDGVATGPAGVLRLTAVGDGSRFVGRFEQATSGVFGVGRINLTRVATGGTVGAGTVGTGTGGTGTVGADGSVLIADGSLLRPDGTLIAPDGTVIRVGTGTGGNVGTVGAIGTAPGATGASATNSPIGVVGTAPGAIGATPTNSLFGPTGTAPGATSAGVTNGTTFGLSPITPGSTGAFSGLGTFGAVGTVGTVGAGDNLGTIRSAGTAIGSPAYAAASTSLGSPIYTYSPVGSPAYTGTNLGTAAYIGSPASSRLGAGRTDGFDVIGNTSSTGGTTDSLLAGQFDGSGSSTVPGSLFANG